jgi:anti-sigma regulatory factor (Ser/Thr protein kinase)/GAF domain-containing protein
VCAGYASAVIDPKSPPEGGRSGSRLGWGRGIGDVLLGAGVTLVIGLPFLADPDGTARYRPGALLLGVLVVVAAWRGVRAGIAAAVVSTVIVWYLFTQPQSSFAFHHWEDVFALGVYALTATLVLLLVARLADARRRERFQRALVDTLVDEAPVGLAYLDADLLPQRVNQYLEDDPGPPLEDRATMQGVLDTGQAVTDREISREPHDGQPERYWRVSYYPVRDDHRVTGIGAVVVDATDDVLMRRRRVDVLEFAQAITGLTTRDDAADAAARFLTRTFGCRGAVGFRTDDGRLEIVATAGLADEDARLWNGRRVPISGDAPITDAMLQGTVVMVSSAAEMLERYPVVATRPLGLVEASAASFPLRAHDLDGQPVMGVLHLSWPYDRVLTEHSRVTLLTVAAMMEAAALQLQRAEQATEERFRAALEAMVNTVAITRAVRDETGRIVDFEIEFINGPGVAAPRRTASQLIGRHVSELYPAWADNRMLDRLVEVVETGIPHVATRVPFKDVLDDGSEIDGFLDVQAVKFDDGYLLSAQNVTEAVLGEARARELEIERGRREIVDRLAVLTTALAEAVSVADVADAACRHGAAAADADLGVIAVREGTRVVLRLPDDTPEEFAHGRTRLTLEGSGPFLDAMERGERIVIESTSEQAPRPGTFVHRMASAALESVAFIPLAAEDGRVLGALAFAWRQRQSFSAGDDQRVTAVATVVSTALQRAVAAAADAAHGRQTDQLARLAAELAGAADADTVWRVIAEHLIPLFDASNGAVGRLDERSRTLQLTYTDALVSSDPWPALRVSLDVRAPVSDAVHDQRAVVCDSRAELEARYPDLTYRAVGDWDASAAVPVIATTGVLGVLGIALPPGRVFDSADRGVLEVVGSVVGQAAARAELFERERTRRRLSEAFRRASAEIAASLPEEAATMIGRRAAAALGTTWYGVYAREDDTLHLLEAQTDRHHIRTEVRLDEALPVVDVVRTGEPIVLADAEEWAARYPQMLQFPPAPTINLPLFDERGDVAIVLGIGFPRESRLPKWIVENLDTIVDNWSDVYQRALATMARARVAEREHEIAVALQHAMLGQPDDVLRAEYGVSYRAADGTLEVGGDWYDVIGLGDRRVAVVVGDVVGHHLAAAAAMGQLRSAVRALAPITGDPAQMLTRLDDIVEQIDGALSTTMLYGVLECDTGTFHYSCAGHLPPLLVTVDGEARFLEGGRSVPLGGFVTRPRETATACVSVQDWILLYSDGLVERRGESLDDGFDRLVQAARTGRLLDAPSFCRHVVSSLLADTTPRDDVVVLAVRPLPNEIHLRRPAEPEMLRGVRETLRAWLRGTDASTEEIEELVLSAGEALTNAIEHATPREQPAFVELAAVEREGVVHIEVRDHGTWAHRVRGADPTRGRGLQILRHFTDDVVIRQGEDGTSVEMARRLTASRARP